MYTANELAFLKVMPKTKRGEETLAKLVEVAEELFTEKNYYNTSVSEIIVRAGISIGAYYIYFNDKLSLYKYTVLYYGRRLRKHISTHLSLLNLSTRYEMEREGIKIYLQFCMENPKGFSIIWQSLFVAPELFIDYYDDFGKQYKKRLEDAANTGDIRKIDLEVASYVLMGVSNFLALKYVTFGPPKGLTEKRLNQIVDDVMAMFENGLFMNIKNRK